MSQEDIAKRFGLYNGQFFAEYKYKNLWWFLNEEPCGFGDLRDEDILRIKKDLVEGEMFVGWNEHHMGRFQHTDTPMVRITHNSILHRADIVISEGR